MTYSPASPERLDRYARHIVLPEVGGAGQFALSQAHVCIVGLGGIGSPVLQYLAGAGVGQFTLIDDGDVEASNLQRQTIYAARDVGHGKAVSARRWLANFDAALEVTLHDERVTPANAERPDRHSATGDRRDGQFRHPTRRVGRLRDPANPSVIRRHRTLSGTGGGVCGALSKTSPATVASSATPSMPRIATPAPRMACLARWSAGPAASPPCRPYASCCRVTQRLAAYDGGAKGAPWGQLHLMDGLAPSMRTHRVAKGSCLPDLWRLSA